MSATPRGLAAWLIGLFVAFGLIGIVRGQDPADNPTPPMPPGQEVQTRGPVHESFAQPVVYDPKPGPVIPRPPPRPIEEMPPDQKPEGANVRWIPGYWAWDDSRRDYLWISGVWRNIPPGRQWNPGYWHEVEGGVQWAPGAWTPTQSQGPQQYYPAPPASIESGPNSPMPADGSVWSPGCWVWADTRYAWQPGFWVPPQPNWVWIPPQYVWSPGGYMFVPGYWDRPLATRGVMFAPVYFSQPVYAQPAFVYTPAITIAAGGLMASLFVRPSFGVYYFGDYYAANYASVGIYPWFTFHQSRFGYDPMFAYYSVTYARTNPRWVVEQREAFLYRREHVEARPFHTYAEMARVADARRSFATPLARLAAEHPAAFARVEAVEQRRIVQHAAQVQRFQQERAVREVALRERAEAAPNRPHAAEMPRSPIAAEHHPAPVHAEAVAPHHTPPAAPAHPALDHAARPAREVARPSPRPEPAREERKRR